MVWLLLVRNFLMVDDLVIVLKLQYVIVLVNFWLSEILPLFQIRRFVPCDHAFDFILFLADQESIHEINEVLILLVFQGLLLLLLILHI